MGVNVGASLVNLQKWYSLASLNLTKKGVYVCACLSIYFPKLFISCLFLKDVLTFICDGDIYIYIYI